LIGLLSYAFFLYDFIIPTPHTIFMALHTLAQYCLASNKRGPGSGTFQIRKGLFLLFQPLPERQRKKTNE
jgi:hypothetical protein